MPKSAIRPGSIFNRQGGSVFNQRRHQHAYACSAGASIPDFAVVLDTSGSMSLNINTSAADEVWFNQIGNTLPDNNPRKARMQDEPTRLSVAKHVFGARVS